VDFTQNFGGVHILGKSAYTQLNMAGLSTGSLYTAQCSVHFQNTSLILKSTKTNLDPCEYFMSQLSLNKVQTLSSLQSARGFSFLLTGQYQQNEYEFGPQKYK
jgi:hypothetical protein